MAQVLGGNQVKLNNGQTVSAQQGAWYDGQQFWGGTLSNAGQINSQSNQQGAGQQVSNEVVAQTNPNNVAYIQQQQNQPQQQSGGGVFGSTGGTGTGAAFPADAFGAGGSGATTLNLPELYKSLYASSGVTDLEKQLADMQTGLTDATGKINDNPFLSESTRVGRVAKLNDQANQKISQLTGQIATKKADIETQMNIQTKQFDINSQAAQQALSTFNTLLQAGALDNASPDDIANITRSTGLSSQAIQSAVSANKAKNVQTSVIQYDDGTNQGFAVINSNTGEVISRQNVAASKPPASSGTSDVNSEIKATQLDNAQAPQVLLQGAKLGKTLPDMIAYGAAHDVSAQDVYNIYSGINYYHATAAQVKADKKTYGLK